MMHEYSEINRRVMTEEEEEEFFRQFDEILKITAERCRDMEEPEKPDPEKRRKDFLHAFYLADQHVKGEHVSVNAAFSPYSGNVGILELLGQSVEFDSSVFLDIAIAADNFEAYYEGGNAKITFEFINAGMEA